MKIMIMVFIGIIMMAVIMVLLRLYKIHQIKQKRKSKNDLDGMFLLNEHPHKHK